MKYTDVELYLLKLESVCFHCDGSKVFFSTNSLRNRGRRTFIVTAADEIVFLSLCSEAILGRLLLSYRQIQT
jgi:hypothetical protein